MLVKCYIMYPINSQIMAVEVLHKQAMEENRDSKEIESISQLHSQMCMTRDLTLNWMEIPNYEP